MAWALNFWRILNIIGSDTAKEKEKNCGSISLYMNVTIPDTHGSKICLKTGLVGKVIRLTHFNDLNRLNATNKVLKRNKKLLTLIVGIGMTGKIQIR